MADIRTVLFDLDGTLADTAPDLANSLNAVRLDRSLPQLDYELIRPIASHGSPGLIQLGFECDASDPGYDRLRQDFLDHYRQNLCVKTRLFDGISELLMELSHRGISWGVVTNKPQFLTDPLIQALSPRPPPACIVSGDSTRNRKPHPEPLLHACQLAGCRSGECVYVGDAERDIAAGRMAGMKTIVALFGYIGENETPSCWGADGMITHPRDLLDWLDERD